MKMERIGLPLTFPKKILASTAYVNYQIFAMSHLSRNFVGRIIVAIYYDSGAYQLGMKKLILIALVLLALFVISARIFFRWYRKTRARELKIVYSVMKISFLL